jgi:N-acetylglutamate synthase-like GNAT family acetyltransferase
MKRAMNVRMATPEDAEKMAEWIQRTPNNGFDPAIADYPGLMVLVVEKDGEPIMYLPVHPVLCIESVACKPGISGREYIEALLQVKSATEHIARQNGIREIYTSSVYEPMAKTLRRHGYATMPGTLRKKV